MKRLIALTAALAILGAALLVLTQAGTKAEAGTTATAARLPAPANFFGIAPQTALTPDDARHMKAGGIEMVRLSLSWAAVQPKEKSAYDWSAFDTELLVAVRAGLRVLPSVGLPPRWIGKPTTLPVNSARARNAWSKFLRAAVKRYGPGGEFWAEHRQTGPGPSYEPALPQQLPIKEWQIWNEENFFYFTFPVNPARYAQFVTISSQAIKSRNPGGKLILGGLFARPKAKDKRGMSAVTYLEELYKYPGIKARFDGIDLHPYAIDSEELEAMIEEFHDVAVKNHDRPGLYITELGWGSENNFKEVAFEQGPQGQAKQLRRSYEYMLKNQRRLNLKQAYWFSWKDVQGQCNFCDSVGLFHEGPKFKPKPAWRTFVAISGGRVRPGS